jgi:uncharacterized phiE125 gp8 family phage protein
MAQLITLTEAKEYLKIDYTDEDSLLNRLITQATSILQRKYKRDIVQTTYTDELYNGEGHELLFIRNFPIQSITDLSIKAGDTWQTISTNDYEVVQRSGMVKYNGIFPDGWNNIKISYVGGYAATDSELETFKNECLLLVSDLYEGRGGEL